MKYLLPLVLVSLWSCEPESDPREIEEIMGYAPIYANSQNPGTIAVEPIRATSKPGKIYAYGNYLFQVEQNEGIHIIDNSIPQQANKISFLKIPFCTEISIRSGYLYTNHLNDLVVFDMSNIVAPYLVYRLENAFPVIDQNFPPFSGTYFECPDPSRGIVIGWEQKLIKDPKCRR